MNAIAYFEIQVSNLNNAILFYKNVFEWDFVIEPNLPIPYYRIETKGINGGLLQRPIAEPPRQYGTNAFTCSIQVGNFDETAQKIIENGGQIAMPKFSLPKKCYQGYFLDLDNNVFGIFEANENA